MQPGSRQTKYRRASSKRGARAALASMLFVRAIGCAPVGEALFDKTASDTTSDGAGGNAGARGSAGAAGYAGASVADAAVERGAGADASVDVGPDADVDRADGGAPWTLVWSDEFQGADGSAVDASKWNYDVGGGDHGWGNNELEYYTSGTDNASIRNGMLVITASSQGASKYTCFYGPCRYTSARLTTSHKFAQRYGRFEARIQIPRGHGMWPAFWMLGQDFPTPTDWPACGEIDIMENIGNEPSIVHGTLHGPGPAVYVDEGIGGTYALPIRTLADDFHVYAVEWDEAKIAFYIDDQLYKSIAPSDLPSGAKWVWDHPFFLILNVALGGDWPNPPPDATTDLPQTMIVDYVRAYRRQ